MSTATKSDAEIADELADRVNRLIPRSADPEKFHVDRDGIARELRLLAKRLRGDLGRRREHVWRPDARPAPAGPNILRPGVGRLAGR
jgi:hypothetical protein